MTIGLNFHLGWYSKQFSSFRFWNESFLITKNAKKKIVVSLSTLSISFFGLKLHVSNFLKNWSARSSWPPSHYSYYISVVVVMVPVFLQRVDEKHLYTLFGTLWSFRFSWFWAVWFPWLFWKKKCKRVVYKNIWG